MLIPFYIFIQLSLLRSGGIVPFGNLKACLIYFFYTHVLNEPISKLRPTGLFSSLPYRKQAFSHSKSISVDSLSFTLLFPTNCKNHQLQVSLDRIRLSFAEISFQRACRFSAIVVSAKGKRSKMMRVPCTLVGPPSSSTNRI